MMSQRYGNVVNQGIDDVLCDSCERLKWKTPTKIQIEAIPVALEGENITQCYYTNKFFVSRHVFEFVNTKNVIWIENTKPAQ